jgi:ABC-2 type transport system permease protein
LQNKLNISPIVKKEFRQIRRDPRALAILLLMPAFLLVMVGYALNFDVKNISLAIYDEDISATSHDFIESFNHSEYFNIKYHLENSDEIDHLLEDGHALAAIVIPRDFSKLIQSGKETVIQVLVDGSNANTASTALGYINIAIQSYSNKILLSALNRQGKSFTIPINAQARLWYNPELKSSRFLIPGLFGMILMLVAVVSTTLSIVREKEQGTMEQIIVSPLRSIEIILGKTIPYLLVSLIATTIVLIFSALLFGVKIQGNIILFYLSTFLFLLGALGQGLLISTFAETQSVAYIISILSSLLPTFLLSGFIFPVKNMPLALQIVTHIIPAKYYLVAVRSVMLKGVGIPAFWEQLVFLVVFCTVIIGVSVIRMRRDLE